MLFVNQKKSVFSGMLTLVLVMFIIASAVQVSQGCSTGGELAAAFNCEEHVGTKGMCTHIYTYIYIHSGIRESVLSM